MDQTKPLLFDDLRKDPSLRPLFDAAVEGIRSGSTQLSVGGRGDILIDGRKILDTAVLEYVLDQTPAEFDAAAAQAFTERLRQLLGWKRMDYSLKQWFKTRLYIPYVKPTADRSSIPEGYFRFACYIAVNERKYGPSFAAIEAERIFKWVTQLGSDLPARLKKNGSGELPQDLADFRAEGVHCQANDVLAVIRIDLHKESEAGYAAVLDYLCRLLTSTDFPRSYAIEFSGPTQAWLPIDDLPQKSVQQLFACTARYSTLWPAMERYARAAMRRYEWYSNVEEENCAMPGSFAVFALGLLSPARAPLVLDYLKMVVGGDQRMHGRFVEACIDAYGFSAEAVSYLVACVGNIQYMPHRESYPALMANRASLQALLQARSAQGAVSSISTLRANLVGERVDDHDWRRVLHAIWGEAAEQDGGRAIIDQAPTDLRPFYEQVFA